MATNLSQASIYGEAGYTAYATFTGGKTWDGKPMPKWDELPERIQDAWAASGQAIIELYIQWRDMNHLTALDYDLPVIGGFHDEE